MRLPIIILIALSFACSKKEDSVPTEQVSETEVSAAKPDAPAENATPTEAAWAGSQFDQAGLPAELQGPAPSQGERPSLRVVEPGSNPSHRLRWEVKPGFEQMLSMNLRSRAKVLIGGVLAAKAPWHSATYAIKLKAEKVEPGGALRVAVTIDELEAQYEEGKSPALNERLAKAVAQLRGLTGAYTMDPRGWVKSVELGAPPDALREAHDMVDNLKWAFHQMIPSLPQERVGVGTQWTVHRGAMQGGIAANELSTMQISKLQGTRVDIKTQSQQAAQPQTFQLPGYPVPMELVKFAAEGKGEVWWDLRELTPRTARVIFTVHGVFIYDKDGERLSMFNTTTRSLRIPAK
ncbi:MAG: hypothetical protein JRH14_16080 [Deltaproteobacteria bacterium]|nr:hypothetical protein [Deltaproteobacteria bacterium]